MTLQTTLQSIYDLPLSNAIRENANAFPVLESLHVLAIVAAGINMAIFHATTQRTIAQWDETAAPPFAARAAGVLSLVLWTLVIFLGRWIGFTLDVLF